MANYIYISPLTAIAATVLVALLGAPVWMVVLSFFVAGSGAAFAAALLIFFSAQRSEDTDRCKDHLSRRHSTLIGF